MVKPKLLGEKPISMIELKQELDNIKKRDKELGFRAGKTEEYLNHFVKIDAKQAEELRKKLEGLEISRLKEEMIIKIMDLMPTTVDELKTILQSYTANINKKDMDSIVGAVAEYAPAAKK